MLIQLNLKQERPLHLPSPAATSGLSLQKTVTEHYDKVWTEQESESGL